MRLPLVVILSTLPFAAFGAEWERPVLEVGRFSGPDWETLATIPLGVEEGKLTWKLDGDLAHSILVVRSSDAPPRL